ncbi:hypothetical protein [Ruminiclostridium josui]|nr:hypothetical protein [Ruminiclostridium josui]
MNTSGEIKCCENCIFSMDYGESVQFIKCEKSRKYVDKKGCCKHFCKRD